MMAFAARAVATSRLARPCAALSPTLDSSLISAEGVEGRKQFSARLKQTVTRYYGWNSRKVRKWAAHHRVAFFQAVDTTPMDYACGLSPSVFQQALRSNASRIYRSSCRYAPGRIARQNVKSGYVGHYFRIGNLSGIATMSFISIAQEFYYWSYVSTFFVNLGTV